MKLLFAFFLVSSIAHMPAAFISSKDAGERLIVQGEQRRWLADDLKAYHQEMRKAHKNYIPSYPDTPILVPVSFGTPQRMFWVSFETGSDALFVLSPDYPSLNATEQPAYEPERSSTSEYAGKYEEFTGDVTVYGSAYIDLVGVLGLFHILNGTQRFGVVKSAYDDYSANPVMPDGVWGLSWDPVGAANPNENSSSIINFFQELGDVPRYWCQYLFDVTKPEGRVHYSGTEFGGCLEETCEPATPQNTYPLVWIEESRSLAFELASFRYKDVTYAGGYAKVDTGVPLVLMPYDSFLAVYDDVEPDYDFDHALYTVDCEKAGSLPDWTFVIGGNNYTVTSSTYVVDLLLPDDKCAFSAFISDRESTDYVLGYVFHDLWCIKMDIDNQAISIMDLRPLPTLEPPTN